MHQKHGLSRRGKAGVAVAVVVVAIALSILAFLLFFRRRNRVGADREFGIESREATEHSPTAHDGKSRFPTGSSNVLETVGEEEILPKPATGLVSVHGSSGGHVHNNAHADGGNVGGLAAIAPQAVVARGEPLSVEGMAVSTGPFDCTRQSETLPAERAALSARPYYGTGQREIASPLSGCAERGGAVPIGGATLGARPYYGTGQCETASPQSETVPTEGAALSARPYYGTGQHKVTSPLSAGTVRESGSQLPSNPDVNTPPQTQEQHVKNVSEFVARDLPMFTQPGDPGFAAIAEKAVKRAVETADKFEHPELFPKLTKLWFYKIIILCDDSWSMVDDRRWETLKDILQRVAGLVNVLKPQEGMSMRFLNYDNDEHFDDLKDAEEVEEIVKWLNPNGETRLGGVLDEKVVQPMITGKAISGNFKQPVIVLIITDGEPTEERDTLKNTIAKCKKHPALKPYGDAAVIFLISQVGSSVGATQFLAGLERDPDVGNMVFCTSEKLDEQAHALSQWGNREYTAWLIDLFATALQKQSRA
ncbi:MAG: hypothetical protein M1840_004904 [Geoglossum simile]|nr:MAG: hypothetical protein M1840_004904 [Geoglossum simile]